MLKKSRKERSMKKKWFIKITAIILVTVFAAATPCQLQAASYKTWDSLPEEDIRDTQIYDLHDIKTYCNKKSGLIDRFHPNFLLPP